jgi:hypothetical protein
MKREKRRKSNCGKFLSVEILGNSTDNAGTRKFWKNWELQILKNSRRPEIVRPKNRNFLFLERGTKNPKDRENLRNFETFSDIRGKFRN